MATLSLSNQKTATDAIGPYKDNLKALLDQRKDVWGRCPIEKKRIWIDKDPAMKMAWELYQYLKDMFGEVDNG